MLQHIWLLLTFRHRGQGLSRTPLAFAAVIVGIAVALDAFRFGVASAEPMVTAAAWTAWAIAQALGATLLWAISRGTEHRPMFAGWYMIAIAFDVVAITLFAAGVPYPGLLVLYEVAAAITFATRLRVSVDQT